MRSSVAYVDVMRYRFRVLLRVRETRRSEGWRQRAENTACVPALSSSRRWCPVHQRVVHSVSGGVKLRLTLRRISVFWLTSEFFLSPLCVVCDSQSSTLCADVSKTSCGCICLCVQGRTGVAELALCTYLDGREDHGGSGVWLVRVTEERLTSEVGSLVKSTRGGVKPK